MHMKFIPYEKLSKKEKKRIDSQKRRNWGNMSPVTRIKESRKTYSRKGRRAGGDDFRNDGFSVAV